MTTHKGWYRACVPAPAETWRLIEAEGGGVYQIAFFSPFSLVDLVAQALAGDALATAQVNVIDGMLAQINGARTRARAPQCLLCGSPVWRRQWPARIGVLTAACDRPSQAFAHIICRDCEARYTTAASFNEAVATFYREHVMDDARVLSPLSAPGHA